jgi:hypothetical protein
MSFQNDDLLLVNRSGTSFKTEYGLLRERIIEGVGGATVSETEPTGEHEGDLWYQPSTDSLFVWVVTDTTGVVTSVTVRNGGSGYTTNETNVATIGGDGEGLTLDIQAGVGGNYASPTVNQGGSGYAVGNVVFLIGAGNQNGSANVTAVNTVATGAWEAVGAADGASVSVGDTAPANPEQGDLWYDTDSGRLFVWYEDANTNQWVDASPSGGGDGGDTTIQYNGASAWGSVNADATVNGALNCTVSKTVRPDGTTVAEQTGLYYVTFNNALPNGDYAVTTAAGEGTTRSVSTFDRTAQGFTVHVGRDADGIKENRPFCFAVHSSNALPPRGGTGADAWGSIAADGSDLATFNSSASNTGTGIYRVTFTNSMPTANYSVNATVAEESNCYIRTVNKTADSFDVQIIERVAYALQNVAFDYVVHATNAQLPDTVTQEQLDAVLDNWTRTGTTLSPTNDGDNVHIGTTADPDNIQLNADGRAEFAGYVEVAGDPAAGDVGCRMEPSGIVSSSRTDSTQAIYAGYTAGSTSRTFEVLADGTANFNGVHFQIVREADGASTVNVKNGDGSSTVRIFGANGTIQGTVVRSTSFMSDLTPEQQTTYGIQELDVKEKVLNFITRVAQLEGLGVNLANRLAAVESNEIIDDATDTSLLQLLANASSRLDSIEARLTALEGN